MIPLTRTSWFLVAKLYNLGIRGTILKWIESYVTNRKMVVKYDGARSETRRMELGVPQGSVLGPLLFLLYVNDLPEYVRSGYVTMYADDTTVVVAADSLDRLCEITSSVCNDMEMWCKRNGLILNIDKTVYMNMFIRNTFCQDTYEKNMNINLSNKVKFLGTQIDPQLSFSNHIDHVCAKLNSAYFALLSLKSCLDEDGLLSVYYSLAYSHMTYNVVSWGGAGTNCNRIFINQKRILRLIFNLDYRESCRDVFIQKRILTFPSIYTG